MRIVTSVILASALAACAGEEAAPQTNAGGMDAGMALDAGSASLCPEQAQARRCTTASDCQEDRSPPSNCAFCVPANDAICRLGECVVPERLEQTQSIVFSFNAADLVGELASFARFAVTKQTSGGLEITCEDVLGGLDWQEQCYNVIDSRSNMSGMTSGGAFTVLFSQIPAGQPTLFVVYGFEEEDTDGAPIGVACEELVVPERGATNTATELSGGDMRSLR